MDDKDQKNAAETLGDAQIMIKTKKGRRVLLAVLGIGFLVAIIVVALIRAC